MRHGIKSVLLDMDGTQLITEPRNRRVHETTARKYGGQIDKSDWNFLAGTSDRIIWNHLKNKFNHFAVGEDDYVAEIEYGYLTDTHGVILRPGMAEIFQRAADRGLIVATVTNSSRKVTDVSLKAHGLERKMHLVLTKDEVLAAGLKTKPAPDPYLMAARTLGVDIAHCLIFEDSKNGARSGVAALAGTNGHGGVIQIIDQGDESQYEPTAHAHARSKNELVAACYKFIP